MSTQARYKMVLNPRESERAASDQAYAADRKKIADDYAVQVEAPVDLHVSGRDGSEVLLYATDAQPEEAAPVTVPTGKKVSK